MCILRSFLTGLSSPNKRGYLAPNYNEFTERPGAATGGIKKAGKKGRDRAVNNERPCDSGPLYGKMVVERGSPGLLPDPIAVGCPGGIAVTYQHLHLAHLWLHAPHRDAAHPHLHLAIHRPLHHHHLGLHLLLLRWKLVGAPVLAHHSLRCSFDIIESIYWYGLLVPEGADKDDEEPRPTSPMSEVKAAFFPASLSFRPAMSELSSTPYRMHSARGHPGLPETAGSRSTLCCCCCCC